MPSQRECAVIVITADQINSRSGIDAVPDALDALAALPAPGSCSRGFARTAGDEIQAVFERSDEALSALETLARLGVWRVGVGIGDIVTPVPDDVRAASGSAFVAARHAVEASNGASSDLAVRSSDGVWASRVEAALAMVQLVWRRRTDAGWQVAALLADGRPQRDVAAELGVTASAVSQRARVAAVDEVDAAKGLIVWLLDEARTGVSSS